MAIELLPISGVVPWCCRRSCIRQAREIATLKLVIASFEKIFSVNGRYSNTYDSWKLNQKFNTHDDVPIDAQRLGKARRTLNNKLLKHGIVRDIPKRKDVAGYKARTKL